VCEKAHNPERIFADNKLRGDTTYRVNCIAKIC
jgi:hypothetical protein